MFVCGQPQFAETNELLNRMLAQARPLIAAHRGTSGGSVVENTSLAVSAALREGAEMVEIDVVSSTDGEFFLFHDGLEPQHLGTKSNMRTMSSAEIRSLEYRVYSSSARAVRVEELGTVLRRFAGDTLFNVDRSWWYWPALLDFLDQFEMAGQIVLKSPVDEVALKALREHPVKYPFAPMVKSASEIDSVYGDTEINLVGLELLAPDDGHEFVRKEFIDSLHESGLFCLVNAINLPDRVPLFASYDDEVSMFGDVNQGWGRLFDLGLDIIQTDWPAMLAKFRLGRASARQAVRRP